MYGANRFHHRLIFRRGAALLDLADGREPQLDPGEVLDQLAIGLARVPGAQALQKLRFDLDVRSRGDEESLRARRSVARGPPEQREFKPATGLPGARED
jgi:hypothetical protein